MRVVVCGGRKYANEHRVRAVLDAFWAKHGITALAHGGATGADTFAGRWANDHEIPCTPYPVTRADWARLGPSAGPQRNGTMLRAFAPDQVIAFAGGRGTADCIRQATAMDIPVMTVAP